MSALDELRIWPQRLAHRTLLSVRDHVVTTADLLRKRIHPDAIAAEKARWHARATADIPTVPDDDLLRRLREIADNWPSRRNVARFLEATRRSERARP